MTARTVATRCLLGATVFLGVVLVTTGVSLVLTYAPGREQALGLTRHPAVSPTRLLHRVAGVTLLAVVAGLVATSLGRRRVAAGASMVLVLVGALVGTGYQLPWDQLALSATQIAGDYRGMITAAFDANVDVVRIGGREVDQSDFRVVLLTHVAVLPLAVAATGLFTARAVRRGAGGPVAGRRPGRGRGGAGRR